MNEMTEAADAMAKLIQGCERTGYEKGLEAAAQFVETHTLHNVSGAWPAEQAFMFGISPEHKLMADAIRALARA